MNLLTQAASDADDDTSMNYYQNQRNALDANIKAELLAQANNSDNQAFIDGYEDVIRRNPQMFPLFTKYYLNGDWVPRGGRRRPGAQKKGGPFSIHENRDF